MVLGAAVVVAAAWLGGCGSPSSPVVTPSPAISQAPVQTYTDSGDNASVAAPAITPAERAMLARVHVIAVSIAAGGHYVSVQFKAPPKLARDWRSEPLSVTDERTHRVYDQIPTVPLIGSLMAPPHKEGQVGYVMFLNVPSLQPGDRVTVVLGQFKKKHVSVGNGGVQ